MKVDVSPIITKHANVCTVGLTDDANYTRPYARLSVRKRIIGKDVTATSSRTTGILHGHARTVTGMHTRTLPSRTNTAGLSGATRKQPTMTDDLIAERGSVYGTPQVNLGERTARLWTAYLRDLGVERDLDGRDVSALMILLKIARVQQTADHDDSWHDIAGYALNGLACAKVQRD